MAEASAELQAPTQSPLEKRVSRAVSGITSNSQSLLDVGVTQEQIDAAVKRIEDKVRREYEDEKKQDVFKKIEKALTDAAQAPEEKALADLNVKLLEENRAKLKKELDLARRDSRNKGETNPTFRDLLFRTNFHGAGNLGPIMFPSTERVLGLSESQNTVMPSREFQGRILKNLGVLEENENMDSLEELPANPTDPNQPYFKPEKGAGESKGVVRNLPTDIPGLKVGVDINSRYPNIFAEIDLEQLEKVANFQPEPQT